MPEPKDRVYQQAYYRKNKERLQAYKREYHRKNRRERKNYWYKYAYGWTLRDIEALNTRQGGACAICEQTEKRLVVDHCHTKGYVRGLLCGRCNTILGYMDDNPNLLRKAAQYLERAQAIGVLLS